MESTHALIERAGEEGRIIGYVSSNDTSNAISGRFL